MNWNKSLRKLISPIQFYSGSYHRQWSKFSQNFPCTAVLCYHRISAHKSQHTNQLFSFEKGITAKDFEAQIKFMLRYFEPIKPSEVLSEGDKKKQRFAVTFDDGYEDNYTVAAPILKRLGVPAAFYVVSDYVGTDKLFWWDSLALMFRKTQKRSLSLQRLMPELVDFAGEACKFKLSNHSRREYAFTRLRKKLSQCRQQNVEKYLSSLAEVLDVSNPANSGDFPLMDWDQLRDLFRQGFEIGGHSATHINLARATADELKREILDSVKTMENEIGGKVLTFAYPYGHRENYNHDVAEAARSAEFLAAFTSERRVVGGNQNRFMLPRLPLNRGLNCACAFQLHNAFLASRTCFTQAEAGFPQSK